MLVQFILLACFDLTLAKPEAHCHGCSPIVKSPSGHYQGSILTSRLGREIFSYRGIPYAQPPINELRFKPPEPMHKIQGIFNATKEGVVCPTTTTDPVSEDCLQLSVYTTKLPEGDEHPKRPVIVYIHAGGYWGAEGSFNWAGPQYLLDQDVVLVTFNYRVGSLGFLSTGDKEAPGNNGLKDQVLLLKWVKQNIEYFGGDSNSVTIYGYSAGGTSVTLHLVSPMSKGLFHKAIISSGSVLGQMPIVENQLDLAKKQAKFVGCPEDTSANIIKCLRTKSGIELGDTLPKFYEINAEPVLIWKPVIEADFGQERFLTEQPVNLVRAGKFEKVPIIIGITAEEFAGWAAGLIKEKKNQEKMDEHWEKYAPIVFLYDRDTENSKMISKSLRKFYFGDKKVDNSTLIPLTEVYSDSLSGFQVNRGAKLLAEKNTHPVYYYKFSYKGRYSHYYLPDCNGKKPYGAVHQDDLLYLFYNSTGFPKFEPNDPEGPIVDKMTTMWANFARTGNPIPETNEKLDSIKWEPFDLKSQKYMNIDKKMKIEEKFYDKRYTEWEKLFPLSGYDKDKKHSS